MHSSVDFSEICSREWGCMAWRDPTYGRDGGDQSASDLATFVPFVPAAQAFQQAELRILVCLLLAACCMFYFAQTLLHQHISPAIPEEQPISPSEGSVTRSAPLDIVASLVATQKPPSGATEDSEAMAQRDRAHFSPMMF